MVEASNIISSPAQCTKFTLPVTMFGVGAEPPDTVSCIMFEVIVHTTLLKVLTAKRRYSVVVFTVVGL